MGNVNNNLLLKQFQEKDRLARKVADLIRSGLEDEELYSVVQSDVMWLVMQMICSPSGAAKCISQSSVS